MDILRENIGLLNPYKYEPLDEWHFPRQEGFLDRMKRHAKYAWNNKGQTAARLTGAGLGYLAATHMEGNAKNKRLGWHNYKGRLAGAALGANIGQYFYNGLANNRLSVEMQPAIDRRYGFFSYQQ